MLLMTSENTCERKLKDEHECGKFTIHAYICTYVRTYVRTYIQCCAGSTGYNITFFVTCSSSTTNNLIQGWNKVRPMELQLLHPILQQSIVVSWGRNNKDRHQSHFCHLPHIYIYIYRIYEHIESSTSLELAYLEESNGMTAEPGASLSSWTRRGELNTATKLPQRSRMIKVRYHLHPFTSIYIHLPIHV